MTLVGWRELARKGRVTVALGGVGGTAAAAATVPVVAAVKAAKGRDVGACPGNGTLTTRCT